jgi:CubicO group peptidase (beta-lactamase class C family)
VLSYDTPVSKVLPEFAAQGSKASVTLRHLLSHTAGLHLAFPSDPTPQRLWERSHGEAAAAGAAPVHPPGARAAMHYYTYGWLLQPLLERAAGKPLAQLVRERVAAHIPAALQGELHLGPMPVAKDGKGDRALATVEYDLRSLLGEQMGDGNLKAAGEGLLSMLGGEEGGEGEGEDAEARELRRLLGTSLRGREFLLDPRMLNASRLVRSPTAGLASLNGRFSARALAELLDGLCRFERAGGVAPLRRAAATPKGAPSGAGPSPMASPASSTSSSAVASSPVPPAVLSLERLREMRAGARDEEPGVFGRLVGREATIRLGMGVQLFGMQDKETGATRYSAYGHAASCGQLALCDLSTGVSVVVTSNKAPLPGGKNVGFEVLKAVSDELGLGQPMPFW